MTKVVVIADDLTGANATGVLFKKYGFKTATFLNKNEYNTENFKDLDVISISTDSRAVEKNEAYKRVKAISDCFKSDVYMFSKRIDSTLRGNVGLEICAVLDSLSDDAIAIVVPAFPQSGRICVGGYLMVNGVMLEKTDVAKDPKNPISTSKVADIVKTQSKYDIGNIYIETILKGADVLSKELLQEKKKGNRIIICDVVTNEDISTIAKAVKLSNINVVAADPGPFSASLAKELFLDKESNMQNKIMLTVGSVSNLTRKQIEKVKNKYNSYILNVDAKKLIYDEYKNDEVEKASNLLVENIDFYNIIGVTTTNKEEEVLNLSLISEELGIDEDEISQRIAEGLSIITKKVLEKTNKRIKGLFTSGGDVTLSVCRTLKTDGIEILNEVLPLAVCGKLTNGDYKDILIVTKGGLIGDENAMVNCIEYILNI